MTLKLGSTFLMITHHTMNKQMSVKL